MFDDLTRGDEVKRGDGRLAVVVVGQHFHCSTALPGIKIKWKSEPWLLLFVDEARWRAEGWKAA